MRGAGSPFLGFTCSCISLALAAKKEHVSCAQAKKNSCYSFCPHVIEKDFSVFLWRLETAILAANCRASESMSHGHLLTACKSIHGCVHSPVHSLGAWRSLQLQSLLRARPVHSLLPRDTRPQPPSGRPTPVNEDKYVNLMH